MKVSGVRSQQTRKAALATTMCLATAMIVSACHKAPAGACEDPVGSKPFKHCIISKLAKISAVNDLEKVMGVNSFLPTAERADGRSMYIRHDNTLNNYTSTVIFTSDQQGRVHDIVVE